MVRLGACSSKGLTPLLVLDEGTADHSCYIKNALPVALKYGNEVFSDNSMFQQDGANPHRYHLKHKNSSGQLDQSMGKLFHF